MKMISSKKELQGPRPPPLNVSSTSHMIMTKKKPVPPFNHSHTHHQLINDRTSRRYTHDKGSRQPRNHQPIVIHLKSPKIIHTKPQDFMNLVQQLTGSQSNSSTSYNPTNSGDEVKKIKMIKQKADTIRTSHGGVSSSSLMMLSSSNMLSPAGLVFTADFMPSPANWLDIGSSIF